MISLPNPTKILSTVMTQPAPTKKDFEQLVDNYVMHIIDGLDYKDMEQMLFDLLQREYEKMNWDDVTEEIVDLYDENTLIDLLPEADETPVMLTSPSKSVTNDETKTDAWSFEWIQLTHSSAKLSLSSITIQ